MTTQAKAFTLIIAAGLLIVILPLSVKSAAEDQVAVQNSGIVRYGTWRKIGIRTSYWTLSSNRADIIALANTISAKVITVYYVTTEISIANFNTMVNNIAYLAGLGFEVWLEHKRTDYVETAGTPTSVQYTIDRCGSTIKGFEFIFEFNANPTEATAWLITKKNQLATYGLQTGYYHGDGLSPDYGNPATDVNATTLAAESIFPEAWLPNDGSWKPGTFALPRFWIEYDVSVTVPEGQSYAEVINWYNNRVITQHHLDQNAGAELIIYGLFMPADLPTAPVVQAMTEISASWRGLPV